MTSAPTQEHARFGQPRSPSDAAALARFNDRMALAIVLAAVIPLFLVPGGAHSLVEAGVFIVSWLVFVVDLVVHDRRTVHYLRTWIGRFDLTVVVLTAPWFLLVGPSESKFVMLIRLARLARVVMATRGARKLFERLGRVALRRGTGRVRGRRGGVPGRAPDEPGIQDLRRRACGGRS